MFVTEDSRPLLACVFCFAKLKQSYLLLRQCLKADELFAQNMSDKYEPKPLVSEKHFEEFGGLIKTPIEQTNIVGCIAVGEQLSAVCEGPDDVIEPKKEHNTDELEPETLGSSSLDVADIPPHCSESDLEDDVPLMICKIEVEDDEISTKKRKATETINTMVNWGLIGAVLAPNMGGWVSTLTMRGQVKKPDGTAWYQLLKKPSWTPPPWLFGPAWTILYSGMGYASFVVYRESGGFTDASVLPLALYGGQLVLNWTWTPVFFGLHRIGLGLLHMLALDAAAVTCTVSFYQVSSTTGYFMIPYLGWLAFATCLNYSIWNLNKSVNEKKIDGDKLDRDH